MTDKRLKNFGHIAKEFYIIFWLYNFYKHFEST